MVAKPLSERLLALAGATTWDGGQGLVRTLGGMLRDAAPYESGEIVIRQAEADLRLYLGTQSQPLAGADLLGEVSSGLALRRFDDLMDLQPFPQTHQTMVERGLRSLLMVSLQSGGGPEGGLVLAHRQAWAFAGVQARELVALAVMAGLCLERALALTRLREQAAASSNEASPDEEALRAEVERLRGALADSVSEVERLRAEAREQRGRVESPDPSRQGRRSSPRRGRRR